MHPELYSKKDKEDDREHKEQHQGKTNDNGVDTIVDEKIKHTKGKTK